MAKVTVQFSDLSVGDDVELTIGETKIVGSVIEETNLGSKVVRLKGNKNKVVVTSRTNFTITKEQETSKEVLDELEVGEVFAYLNKYGKTFEWVKTGEDRYTKVESGRPATSFSSAGFPKPENISF